MTRAHFKYLGLLAVLSLLGCTPASSDRTGGTASQTNPPAVPVFQDKISQDAVGGPPVMRRLTQAQYHTIIADVFGDDIKSGGRFEPEIREAGLLAVGAGHSSIPSSGFEQFDAMARDIAAQVVDKDHRATLIGCTPVVSVNDACTVQYIKSTGRLLFRRPLTAEEVKAQAGLAFAAAKKLNDPYAGIEITTASMLAAPQFLFRMETAEPDTRHAGDRRLTAYTKAERLSFLLWNAAPDDELLTAAEKGALHTPKGLAKQVERLLVSPRLEDGVRAFFTDMLGFDRFATLAKDPVIYPHFDFKVAGDVQEQTLRTIVDHTLARDGDYRDLFTTRRTFMTRTLGSAYRLPVVMPDGWEPYEFAEGDPRAGILTQASFVALHSHPGRSSPTLRGKALREIFLCQKVPDPPGNVNFNLVQDTTNPQFKTVRQRLTAHATEAMCTGCHKLVDPLGLAMEHFDSMGGYRAEENGAPIDTTGQLNGIKFDGAAGLGQAVHDDPAAASCLLSRYYAYAVGRAPTRGEDKWLKSDAAQRFAADGYRMVPLMRFIATGEPFYRVPVTETEK